MNPLLLYPSLKLGSSGRPNVTLGFTLEEVPVRILYTPSFNRWFTIKDSLITALKILSDLWLDCGGDCGALHKNLSLSLS